MSFGPLILGATGNVGQALRRVPADCWNGVPIWQSRKPLADHYHWDILNAAAPDIGCNGIVMLAGAADDDAAIHIGLAKKAATLGARLGVRVLIASTQAVYGPLAGRLSEDTPCQPASEYGAAKLAMEQAVAGQEHVTCMRIGNIVGTDMLGRAVTRGDVVLDRLPNGHAPERAMIGPVTFARVLTGLISCADRLPQTLNVAQPGMVAMDDILAAADVPWVWRTAPDTVLPILDLNVSALGRITDVPTADPVALVEEARFTGWLA